MSHTQLKTKHNNPSNALAHCPCPFCLAPCPFLSHCPHCAARPPQPWRTKTGHMPECMPFGKFAEMGDHRCCGLPPIPWPCHRCFGLVWCVALLPMPCRCRWQTCPDSHGTVTHHDDVVTCTARARHMPRWSATCHTGFPASRKKQLCGRPIWKHACPSPAANAPKTQMVWTHMSCTASDAPKTGNTHVPRLPPMRPNTHALHLPPMCPRLKGLETHMSLACLRCARDLQVWTHTCPTPAFDHRGRQVRDMCFPRF